MLTDTHAHLTSGRFAEDREEVIKAAREAGVKRIICPAENLADAKRIVELAKTHERIWGLAGFYPGNEGEVEKLKQFIKTNREWVVGIGEIGLDIYWLAKQVEKEKEMFRAQLELAVEIELPVVIHNRGAEKEIREVLETMSKLPAGQFHCWSGSDEFLEWVIERDYYVGFCANVTYPKNEKLREQAVRVPLERLLLETDSPYLPPQEKRGERNQPANVKITAAVISEARGIAVEELSKIASNNATRLYQL